VRSLLQEIVGCLDNKKRKSMEERVSEREVSLKVARNEWVLWTNDELD
jgi:hypothetical protein